MGAGVETMLIGAFTAAACALSGSFLVLRKMSMTGDSISHTILLGIVLGFFAAGDLGSPLLIIGAAATGVVTVWLAEVLSKSRLVSSDSAMGVVFPLLFSLAIILIAKYGGSVHLDVDSVMLGELVFAPFDRLYLLGSDIGAKGLYLSLGVLLMNIVLIAVFFKELKITAFDSTLAAVLGFSPVAVHYGLMSVVSVTAVASFETAGSVLVVAFMIAPPAAAYLFTTDMKHMLVLSAAIGVFSAAVGYRIAVWLDVSVAGCMACCAGAVLAAAVLISRLKGCLNRRIRLNA